MSDAPDHSPQKSAGTQFTPIKPTHYPDGRPSPSWRLDAQDQGRILFHNDGQNQCDILGARDPWVYESNGIYYLHYDAAGPKGWLCSLAISKDLIHWEKKGPVLDFGKDKNDSAAACYGVTYFDGTVWHMFYLGSPCAYPAPEFVPSPPYLTMKARADSPAGPWNKQYDITPFGIKKDTYYSETASPGHIILQDNEYVMIFSASTGKPLQRTLGIARTKNLNGSWTVDPTPILPIQEQIENSSLYYEPSNQTWFLFTNHIGLESIEYTDALWVYWSKDLNQWDPACKAVVLDGLNCQWSKHCIGLPSVLKVGNRLAVIYDGLQYDTHHHAALSHMKRDIGLAWLELPLVPPKSS